MRVYRAHTTPPPCTCDIMWPHPSAQQNRPQQFGPTPEHLHHVCQLLDSSACPREHDIPRKRALLLYWGDATEKTLDRTPRERWRLGKTPLALRARALRPRAAAVFECAASGHHNQRSTRAMRNLTADSLSLGHRPQRQTKFGRKRTRYFCSAHRGAITVRARPITPGKGASQNWCKTAPREHSRPRLTPANTATLTPRRGPPLRVGRRRRRRHAQRPLSTAAPRRPPAGPRGRGLLS